MIDQLTSDEHLAAFYQNVQKYNTKESWISFSYLVFYINWI